jgi:hypothetical protein
MLIYAKYFQFREKMKFKRSLAFTCNQLAVLFLKVWKTKVDSFEGIVSAEIP